MKLKIALAAATIAASAMFATGAQANPVYIGYQVGTSGPITVAATGNGNVFYFNPVLLGSWNVFIWARAPRPPPPLWTCPSPT